MRCHFLSYLLLCSFLSFNAGAQQSAYQQTLSDFQSTSLCKSNTPERKRLATKAISEFAFNYEADFKSYKNQLQSKEKGSEAVYGVMGVTTALLLAAGYKFINAGDAYEEILHKIFQPASPQSGVYMDGGIQVATLQRNSGTQIRIAFIDLMGRKHIVMRAFETRSSGEMVRFDAIENRWIGEVSQANMDLLPKATSAAKGFDKGMIQVLEQYSNKEWGQFAYAAPFDNYSGASRLPYRTYAHAAVSLNRYGSAADKALYLKLKEPLWRAMFEVTKKPFGMPKLLANGLSPKVVQFLGKSKMILKEGKWALLVMGGMAGLAYFTDPDDELIELTHQMHKECANSSDEGCFGRVIQSMKQVSCKTMDQLLEAAFVLSLNKK